MPRLEPKGQPPVPVDCHGVDDREPEPVIKLREGFSILRQLEHKAADVLGLGFPLGLCRLELHQLCLGGLVPLCQAVVAFQVGRKQKLPVLIVKRTQEEIVFLHFLRYNMN